MRGNDEAKTKPAIKDPGTRRAVGKYALRALGLMLVAFSLMLASSPFITVDGDTKPGYPEAVPLRLITAALLTGLAGVMGLLNTFRIVWVVARRPWRLVDVAFEEVDGFGTPNGQPTLQVIDGATKWTLTLSLLKWRWWLFDGSHLLFAGRAGRAGVISTVDGAAVAWACRSVFTWFFARRNHRLGRQAGTSEADTTTEDRVGPLYYSVPPAVLDMQALARRVDASRLRLEALDSRTNVLIDMELVANVSGGWWRRSTRGSPG